MMKFPCGGASWTLDSYNSMKICKNPENFLPGLWILLHLNTMYTKPMVTHFVAVVDVTNQKIFSRSSHPDMLHKKDALKYLIELTGKHLYKDAQARGREMEREDSSCPT